ncbi:isochorismatase family protein [Chloroflexota bacterium]
MDNDLIHKEWEWALDFMKNNRRPQRVFKLDKTKTAMLIIDMQKGPIEPAEHYGLIEAKEIVASINTLTGSCRNAGIPVIWVVNKVRSPAEWGLTTTLQPHSYRTELTWDSDGTKILPELEVDTEKDYEITKCRHSAFINGSSNLERLLRALGRDTLIIAGIATNVCVASTAMDAMMLDFKVIVLSDATAAFTDFLQQAFLMSFNMVFADVATTAEVLDEIKHLGKGI